MCDKHNKHHFALSPLLFPSLAQGFWEPHLKNEAFNGQEPVLLPSTGARIRNQGVSRGWARSALAVPTPMPWPHLAFSLSETGQLTGATKTLVTTPGGQQTAITMLT